MTGYIILLIILLSSSLAVVLELRYLHSASTKERIARMFCKGDTPHDWEHNVCRVCGRRWEP